MVNSYLDYFLIMNVEVKQWKIANKIANSDHNSLDIEI